MEKNAPRNVHQAAALDPTGDVGSGSDAHPAAEAHATGVCFAIHYLDHSPEVDSDDDGFDSSSDDGFDSSSDDGFDSSSDEYEEVAAVAVGAAIAADPRYGVELTVFFFFFFWPMLRVNVCEHVLFQLPSVHVSLL